MHPAIYDALPVIAEVIQIHAPLCPICIRWVGKTLSGRQVLLCLLNVFLYHLFAIMRIFQTFCALHFALLVSANPTVTLDSGPIIGTTTSLPSALATVNKFLGVPFAAKPTGSRRFALPTTVPKWTEPIKAQTWSPACVQQFNCEYGLLIPHRQTD